MKARCFLSSLSVFLLALSVNPLQADISASAEILAKACRVGDITTAETLLSFGLDPDVQDQYGRTPLYYAALFGQAKVVALLLGHRADPNRQPPPLQAASRIGDLQIAEMLLAAGAQINQKTQRGRTALHVSVVSDHLDITQLLIHKGADINARDVEGTSPLDDAVWHGYIDAIAILLAHEARLNEPESKTGATPVNEAAYCGNTGIIRYLLLFNPDLEIPDRLGYIPLENAIRMGHADSALLLLDAEAKRQKTPPFIGRIMSAAIEKDESTIVEALFRDGALATGTLPSGTRLLDAAVSAGAVKVVRILLENGADPNMSSTNETSPLEDASLRGFDTIAKMLLDYGALVNHVNGSSGTTALYAAASFGRGNVVNVLLTRGADPNLCGKGDTTPYTAALQSGFADIAARIQHHGGSRNCKLQ